MVGLRLSTSDSAFLRQIRVSVADDLRTVSEAEARFTIPEWLRRTIWRHFWTAHDDMIESRPPLHASSTLQYLDPEPPLSLTTGTTPAKPDPLMLRDELKFGTDARSERRREGAAPSVQLWIVCVLLLVCRVSGCIWWSFGD